MQPCGIRWGYKWGRKLRTFLTTLVIVFGARVIFGVIAARIPARQAAGMEIVRALQYE
jgi:ABC-type lipoprotein release transport system permease subunit